MGRFAGGRWARGLAKEDFDDLPLAHDETQTPHDLLRDLIWPHFSLEASRHHSIYRKESHDDLHGR
jgi:hypothetical protein